MRVYTVYRRPGAISARDMAESLFVPEAFNWRAFILGPLWLAAARAWPALAMWAVVFGGFAFAALWFGFAPPLMVALMAVLAFFTGAEANQFWRGALERRGFAMVDVVAGADIEEAERAYFRRVEALAGATPRGEAYVAAGRQQTVGGLFGEFGN